MHQGSQTQQGGTPCIRDPKLSFGVFHGSGCPGTKDPKSSAEVPDSSGCPVHRGPQTQLRGAPRTGGALRKGDPLLTFLRGLRGVLAAVLLVVLATGAGAAQGGQEQEADPQRSAAHLQQVRGAVRCGAGRPAAAPAPAPCLPARPAART